MLDTSYIERTTGFSEATIQSVLESFIKFVQLELRAGNEVKIVDFGVFYPKELGERQARNPRTGEQIIAKARTKPRVRFFDSFEKAIQNPKSVTLTLPTSPIPPIPPTIPTALPPPVPVAVSRIWHIVKDGAALPIPESQLRGKGKGKITPDTLIWTEGQDGWKSASEVLPQLFA
ncbi:HU family DNA-binding protein [Planktothrix paucivesiculata]|uniref:Histone-like DNA-binding protein n=1 Tax=Planktothrix paucivesiculata PCC 9631 TaxID=671071 RepID=A0A7Z9DY57_9CYAN|nr:HU family DNA-binding protein [Planktothrix paucivesiculata]VXD15457.1 Histone-like DNA-binding protein [Planktothrix paucivesiculata PCC 9631]